MSLLTDKGELRRALGGKQHQQGCNKRGEQHTRGLAATAVITSRVFNVKAGLSRTECLVETKR